MNQLIYAGIGSRETPPDILGLMTLAAKELCEFGWKLRSGGAEGADTAFSQGTAFKEIHLPWSGYNSLYANGRDFIIPPITPQIEDVAARHHPKWEHLSQGVRKLMCRNVTIVLGAHLDQPANMVLCWTPWGRLQGGTAHGMRIAFSFDIPVFNLALEADHKRLVEFVHRHSPHSKEPTS